LDYGILSSMVSSVGTRIELTSEEYSIINDVISMTPRLFSVSMDYWGLDSKNITLKEH
jgi:hypothetical protein